MILLNNALVNITYLIRIESVKNATLSALSALEGTLINANNAKTNFLKSKLAVWNNALWEITKILQQ